MNLTRLFRRPTPIELASKELADAELVLLSANTAREYADSIISYNTQRIARLRAYLERA